jgi:AcrR family transcriptional regulator
MRLLPGAEKRLSRNAPRGITRERFHIDQRLRILRAVGELAGEHGYRKLTLETIAERAHVSHTTFYTHFRDKEQCLLALADNAIRSAEKVMRRRLATQAQPWPGRVALALGTVIELIAAEPQIARATLVESPAVGVAGLRCHHQAGAALAQVFREGRALNPHAAQLRPSVEGTLAGSVIWSLYGTLLVGQPDQLPGLMPGLMELIVGTYEPHL